MKEVSFTIFDLLYISFLKYFYPFHVQKKYLENKYCYRKQIFFECGGGYWSYYCGIVKMMKETYSRNYLDDIAWVGASAGVFPVVNAAYVENPDKTMNYMMHLLSCMPQTWYGGIGRFNPFIYNYCHKDYLQKYKEQILLKQSQVFLAVLNINILCPIFSSLSFYYDFDNMNDFSESCIASHGIPLITGDLNTTLISHPKKWYIKRMDAGVLTVLYGFLFGYNKFLPYGNTLPCHVIYPNIFRPYSLKNAWISPNYLHHYNLYHLGYHDAKRNKKLLDKMIL